MLKTIRSLAGLCTAIVTIMIAPSAFAQDVVVNGGFETQPLASLASWTSTGWIGANGPARTGTGTAGTGCVGAGCLTVGSSGQMYQDVVTTPGTTYTLTFWYVTSHPLDSPFELQALLSNGVPTNGGAGTCTGNCVFQTQTAPGTYTQVTQTYVASSASTRITFLGRNDPQGVYIDDVSLVPAPAPVPTLSEWAMILFGLMLAGGAVLYIQRRQMTV